MSSSSSDGDATPRAQSPQPEIGSTHSEMAEAVYKAVNRQLARDGGNSPEKLAAAAAVVVIIEANTNSTADGSASPPAQAAVDAGPFSSLSYGQCLDFLVSLAKIAHTKEKELRSDKMMYEDGYFAESQIVLGDHEHETRA